MRGQDQIRRKQPRLDVKPGVIVHYQPDIEAFPPPVIVKNDAGNAEDIKDDVDWVHYNPSPSGKCINALIAMAPV